VGQVSSVSQAAQQQLGTNAPNTAAAQDVDLKAARQQQAANARAAKANKQTRVSGGQQGQQTPPMSAPADVAGTNGAGPDDDDDLFGAPSMSPGEAKEAGLALVREVYSAGHVAQVKALQKDMAVAKFYDVPVDQGHVFYERVMQLAVSVGLRQ
jgi:hypothetical protein